jgi:ubiquinone biosynthesis protein
MLRDALAAVGDLARLHTIVSILIRYGFSDMVRRMGLAGMLESAGRVLKADNPQEFAHMLPPQRVRCALEELGPTFVKLGQLLSTRVDLFEPEWIAELSKLQDATPPAPWPDVYARLLEDFGAPPDEVFATFDATPLAAASIAQVHRATLPDGTAVVVKVRRPGIRPVVEADLRWLARIAQLAEAESSDLRMFHPQEMVRQFTQSIRRELDFASECRNAECIAENFATYVDADTPVPPPAKKGAVQKAPVPPIVIPRVYWDWSGERICVQDFVDGIPGRQLAAVDAAGLDRKLLARRGARAVLKMIIDDGVFHADPHPGNVFYLPGNRIAFIDFGMVGRLSETRREELTRLLLGLVKREPERVAEVLLGWTGERPVDERLLTQEIQAFVDQYHGVALKQLKLGTMLGDLLAILRARNLQLPADLALLVKACISLEGMGSELDPDFDMAAEALPILEAAMLQRYAPAAIIDRAWRTLGETLSLITDLPQDLSRLLRAARRGRVEVHIDIPNLKIVGNQLSSAANRLVVGIVVAALIIGSSIVMTVSGGPTLLGLPLFGLLGFLGAAIGGLWLLLSIVRSGRAQKE